MQRQTARSAGLSHLHSSQAFSSIEIRAIIQCDELAFQMTTSGVTIGLCQYTFGRRTTGPREQAPCPVHARVASSATTRGRAEKIPGPRHDRPCMEGAI